MSWMCKRLNTADHGTMRMLMIREWQFCRLWFLEYLSTTVIPLDPCSIPLEYGSDTQQRLAILHYCLLSICTLY